MPPGGGGREEELVHQRAVARPPGRVVDLDPEVRGGHRADDHVEDPAVPGTAALQGLEARVVDERGVHVGGQEDHVLHALELA